MAIRLSSKWTQGEQDKDKIVKLISSYYDDPVLKKLVSLLEDRYKELDRVALSDYDKASWSSYQAHRNGQKAMILEVLDLIDLRNKKEQ